MMKKLLLSMAVCLAVVTANAAGENWMTSLPDAQAKAKAAGKQVFVLFTGSDWCPPCKALHANVLESEVFAQHAAKNLVLVELDFPRRKEQSAELKKANRELATQFKIEGYPTVILLDAGGKELLRKVGFGGDSAGDYVAELSKVAGK